MTVKTSDLLNQPENAEFSFIVSPVDSLIIDYRARDWCKLPYPNHPRSCPNFGKKDDCPPKAPNVEDFFDLDKDLTLIAVRYDLERHAVRLKANARAKGKEISDRQARCVLYWQGKVRKALREFCERVTILPEIYTLIPEAMGVHVIRTAKLNGIPIKTRPERYVWKIALTGYPHKSKQWQQGIDRFFQKG